jgi:hypothetical protein
LSRIRGIDEWTDCDRLREMVHGWVRFAWLSIHSLSEWVPNVCRTSFPINVLTLPESPTATRQRKEFRNGSLQNNTVDIRCHNSFTVSLDITEAIDFEHETSS